MSDTRDITPVAGDGLGEGMAPMIAPAARLVDLASDDGLPRLAASVLAHPITLRLSCATFDALSAIALQDPRIAPGAARQLLRHALTAIEAAEQRLGGEASP